jgi:hypothetical protein
MRKRRNEEHAMKTLKTLKTRRTPLAASLLLLVLLLLLPALAAHAQLSFTLAKPNQVGRPGDTLSFEGTLFNSGANPLFLNGDTFNLGGTGLTLDDSPFFMNGPASLNAGQSFSGQLFTVSLDAAAPAQSALGSFTIQGGATAGDLTDLASVPFRVTVSAPEPASGALLLGLLPAALFVRLALPLVGRATRSRARISSWPFGAFPRPICSAASRPAID